MNAMTAPIKEAEIPESYLEHRQNYLSAWVDRWTIPNPFIGTLFPLLRDWKVELTDFGFNREPGSVGDTYLQIAIRNLNAGIRIGLDHVTYFASNPDWEVAPQLVEVFDRVSCEMQKLVAQSPHFQQLTLAFHVTPGAVDLRDKTSALVNTAKLGNAFFYGVSLHHERGTTVIDKSLRYDGAAYVRLQRNFDGAMKFAEIAPQIYEEETKVLDLLGITGVL